MKDTYYFKHDQDVSGDRKIISLEKRYGYAGTGLFWRIIEQLRSSDGYEIEYDDITFESLAKNEFPEAENIKEFIDYCFRVKLLTKDGDTFYSQRLTRDMEHVDENRKKRVKAGIASGKARQKTDTSEYDDPVLASMVEAYEEITGRMINNTSEHQLLVDLLDTYGYDKVKQAFKDNKDKPIKYTAKVLDGENGKDRPNTETSASDRKRAASSSLR